MPNKTKPEPIPATYDGRTVGEFMLQEIDDETHVGVFIRFISDRDYGIGTIPRPVNREDFETAANALWLEVQQQYKEEMKEGVR